VLLYPIRAAKNSHYTDEVYFSTDSEAYKRIGREQGIFIIDRPPELVTKEYWGRTLLLMAIELSGINVAPMVNRLS
jgi:CMP-N-acetylneuraminic acid synthetase